jgi:hypothetical protein
VAGCWKRLRFAATQLTVYSYRNIRHHRPFEN